MIFLRFQLRITTLYNIIIIFHNYSYKGSHTSIQMIFKLMRRQQSKPSTSDQMAKRKQNEFFQYLSQAIQIICRKQDFYTRVLFIEINAFSATTYVATPLMGHHKTQQAVGVRQHTTYSVFGSNQTHHVSQKLENIKVTPSLYQLQTELDSLLLEEEQLIGNFKKYQQQSFYLSKKFLYILFTRLLENIDYSKRKVLIRMKNSQPIYNKNWEKYYEDNRLVLTQYYQNFIYEQNFNVVELFSLATKKQNYRIWTIIPPKIKKNQIALKPIARLNSVDLKRSHSIEVKPKKDEISEILNKKLKIKQKQQMKTQKRIEERKKPKVKPVTIKDLYGILEIKLPKIEQGYAFRREMEIDCLERNQLILQERKKWQKKCDNKINSRNAFQE